MPGEEYINFFLSSAITINILDANAEFSLTNCPEAFINTRSKELTALGFSAFGGLNKRRIHYMNKTELIAAVAGKADLTKKDAEKFLSAFEDVVTKALVDGQKVQLVGFLTIDVVARAEREGRNPQTGQPMKIAASKAPRFKVGKKLRDAVNGK